jgi:hypothetical protein
MAGVWPVTARGDKIIGLDPRPDRPAVPLMNVAGCMLVTCE